jgi:hypothetical protein
LVWAEKPTSLLICFRNTSDCGRSPLSEHPKPAIDDRLKTGQR